MKKCLKKTLHFQFTLKSLHQSSPYVEHQHMQDKDNVYFYKQGKCSSNQRAVCVLVHHVTLDYMLCLTIILKVCFIQQVLLKNSIMADFCKKDRRKYFFRDKAFMFFPLPLIFCAPHPTHAHTPAHVKSGYLDQLLVFLLAPQLTQIITCVILKDDYDDGEHVVRALWGRGQKKIKQNQQCCFALLTSCGCAQSFSVQSC